MRMKTTKMMKEGKQNPDSRVMGVKKNLMMKGKDPIGNGTLIEI